MKCGPEVSPQSTSRNLVAVQQSRLKVLVSDFKSLQGQEAEAQWQQGRLIHEEIYRYADEEYERHPPTIERCHYREARVQTIANAIGVDPATVRNRMYFYAALRDFADYDSRLSPCHYWKSERAAVADRIPRKSAAALLKSAAQDDPPWSVRRLDTEIERIAASNASSRVPANALRDAGRSLSSSLHSTLSVLRSVLENPQAGEIILDDDCEQFFELLLLYKTTMLRLGRSGATRILSGKDLGLSMMRPLATMTGASYVGSKRRQLYWTIQQADELLPWHKITSACDLFAGRSHVGHALKQLGLEVTVNDRLGWLSAWGKWVVESDHPPLTEKDLKALLAKPKAGTVIPKFIEDGFLWNHRGAMEKVSPENAEAAQRYLANLPKLDAQKQVLARGLLASVFFERMPFSKETHRKPEGNVFVLRDELVNSLREANTYVLKGEKPCRATNDDAVEHLKRKKYDLIYMDPPYALSRAIYDFQLPESIMRGEIVPPSNLPSPFADVTKAKDAFEELLAAADTAAPYWVVAYNSTSALSPRDIGRIMSKYRATTHVAVGHRMAVGTRAQAEGGKAETREWLIVARPYPSRITLDGRVVSQLRDDSLERYDRNATWLTPGAYAEPTQSAGGKKLIEVEIIGIAGGRIVNVLSDLGGQCADFLDAILGDD